MSNRLRLYNSNKLVPGLITEPLSILLACDLLSDRSLVDEGEFSRFCFLPSTVGERPSDKCKGN